MGRYSRYVQDTKPETLLEPNNHIYAKKTRPR